MKTLLTFLITLSTAATFADTTDSAASCSKEATTAAYNVAGDPEQSTFNVYKEQFLGKVELPDLLDGTDSKFFESYYFVLSADNQTSGIMVTTDKSCLITSKKVIGTN